MKIFNEEVVFNAPVRFLSLFIRYVGTFVGATPSVKNTEIFKGSGNVVTVTNFKDGASGQLLRVLGDGTTTIANNATIKTNTGANKLLAANKIYTFSLINNVWYENA